MGRSPQHRQARLQVGVGLLAALALSGCSGTRFGDQLARSFSAPEPAAPAAAPATAGTTTGGGAASPPPAAPPKPVAPAAAPAVAIPAPAPPGAPAPYRVTLRLPLADSSAPAERVTQALRAAGVSFEVETIERIPAGGDGAGASGGGNSAGGNSAGLGAPRRIPAPAPR